MPQLSSNIVNDVTTSQYSSTGYLTVSAYDDADCLSPIVTFGAPVNTCFWAEGFAYKIQLVEGKYKILPLLQLF